MNKIQQIASQVVDKYQFQRQYPVGKAQAGVLKALGINIKINGHSHAQQIFDALGLTVSSKRVGRTSVPVVSIHTVSYGSQYSDIADQSGSYSNADGLDFSAINQWMK